MGRRRLKKSSGKIFYIVREWAVLRLCFDSTWSGSSSHRWWTNVLLRECCTRLGACTAQQRASFAADGLKSSHWQTRLWQTWLLPSICDVMQLKEWDTCLLYCFFSLCLWPSTCQTIPLIDRYWSEQLKHDLVNCELMHLIIQLHHPKFKSIQNCKSCC